MAKTKPIGVRFNEDLLNATGLSPQRALNVYEESHLTFLKKEANDKLGEKVIGVKDLTKPTNLVEPEKPMGSEKSNFVVNTNPKTLDQLKALCPPELTGFDRSEWIRENRLKYKI